VGLAAGSVGGTLLLVPAYHDLALRGATPVAMAHLRQLAGAVQLGPAGLLAVLALGLLGSWLRDVRPLGRGLLVVLVAFSFYTRGMVCVQGRYFTSPGSRWGRPTGWRFGRPRRRCSFQYALCPAIRRC